MRTPKPEISIIVPAYNEEKRIRRTLQKMLKYLNESFHKSYEILVILDGCTDDTPRIVGEVAQGNGNVISCSFPRRLGKGGALLEAFKRTNSDVLLFSDADLSVPPSDLHMMIDLTKNYDLVIGSRYTRGSKVPVKEPFIRFLLGRGFNVILKTFFWRLRGIRDTQCGAKAIKREVVEKILNDVFITGFAFDVNLIYSTLRHGFKVKEVGITWIYEEVGSKVSGNLVKLIIGMLFSIIKLRVYYSRFKPILDSHIIKWLSGFIWKLTQA